MAPNADRALKRRALPLDQTVRWLPLDDAYYLLAEVMTSVRAFPLVVMQEALLQVEMHASSEVYGSTCGVLYGAHYRDPSSNVAYTLVEGIERATRMYRHADPEASIAVDLSRAIDAAEREGHTVIGWYRFDVTLFPRIPLADAGIHRALFPEPWQVALLRDGADGEGSGVFMRVEPTEGRAFPIPFFELIPKKRGRSAKRTSVQWRNYNAESEVLALPPEAYRSSPPQHAKHTDTNGAPNGVSHSAPRAGIFSRLSARLSTARPERPVFPHKPVERVTGEAPTPKLEPLKPEASPKAEMPAEIPKAETLTPEPQKAEPPKSGVPKAGPSLLPVESWTAPEDTVTPDVAALDGRQAEIREAAEAPETAELPERAEAPLTAEAPEAVQSPRTVEAADEVEALEAAQPAEVFEPREPVELREPVEPPETVEPRETVEVRWTADEPPEEIPQDLPRADFEPVRTRTVMDATEQPPPDEMDTLFTEWRPDAAGRAPRHLLAPGGWSISGSTVKRLIATALVLGAGYFGVQRVRADLASRESAASGGVAPQQEQTEGVATGKLEDAATARATGGGFSEAERDEVRSALARVGESRAVLVAHLDTLANTLSGTGSDSSASDSSAAERCTHAAALYQRSLDDIARIDLARKKLTSLVGPMRMAGIDSLSTITSDLHQRLRELCPR